MVEISCARADLRFTDGLGKPRALVLATPDLSLSGRGHINLRNETLKLDFETETRTTSLAILAPPFQVRGTLKAPSVQVDPAAITAGGVEGALSIGESASAALSGLLGGGEEQSSGTSDPCQVAARPAAAPAPKAASEPAAASSGTSDTTVSSGDASSGQQETDRDDPDKSLDEALDDLDRDFNKVLDLFD